MLTCGPSRTSLAVLAATGALLVALAAVGGLDAPGRLLTGLAGAGCALAAGFAALRGPVLAAGPAGLRALDGLRLAEWAWSEVVEVRADLRRRSRGVEIDLGEHLVVVPAFLLGGQDPREVARRLEELRAGAG